MPSESEAYIKVMNYNQAKSQVLNDLHLNDVLGELRRELVKQPKPTIGELISILSNKMLKDSIAKHRTTMQTTFDFEAIELEKYFSIIGVIIVEDYTDLCISEFARMEDSGVQELFNQLKQSCRKCYDEYISGGCNYID